MTQLVSLEALAAPFRRVDRFTRLMALPADAVTSYVTFMEKAWVVRDCLAGGKRVPFTDPRLSACDELLTTTPVSLRGEALLARLHRLWSWSEDLIEESGVSPLMIALGMVIREDPALGTVMSPLMLCPVVLESVSDQPALRALGSPEWNRMLIDELGLDLTRFPADPFAWSADDLAAHGFREVVPVAKLGLYEHDRHMLWRRLSGREDPALAEHPRVRRMIEGGDGPWPGTFRRPETPMMEDPDLDRAQGETVQATRCGVSLVLQGGPGTGKTRVVEHVLGNALQDKRRVLVLCGRGSGFRAIETRLRARGYQDFCLHLHGDHLDPVRLAIRISVPRGASVRETLDQRDRPPPIVMATPASFAMHVPQHWTFDMLVVDEASLVSMCEALPALAVCEQLVVFGDNLQMQKDPPPYVLLDRTARYVPPKTLIEGAIDAKVPTAWLTHHYRSRNTMLIHVTNRIFYDGAMQITASPDLDQDPGFRVRRVDGIFDLKTLTNPVEAEAVVDEIARHIESGSTASVGVIAMTREQRTLIRRRVRERGLDPSGLSQNLIVADYSTIQGEERDVILISMAFGPKTLEAPEVSPAQGTAKPGRKGKDAGKGSGKPVGSPSAGQGVWEHWPTNYGALSLPDGEKRLNVIMTRARERMLVFTSFPLSSVKPARSYAHGQLFSYLYAGETEFRLRHQEHTGVFANVGGIIAWKAYDLGNVVGLYDLWAKQSTVAIYVTGDRDPHDETAEIGQLRNLGWSVHVMTSDEVRALEADKAAQDALASYLLRKFAIKRL